MNILQTPRVIVQLFNRFVDTSCIPEYIADILPTLVTAIALGHDRSYAEQADFVTTDQRNRSSVSRLYQDRGFNSRDMHWNTLERVIATLAPDETKGVVTWNLSLDGLASSRGANTKIKGGIIRGIAKKDKAGKAKAGQGRRASSTVEPDDEPAKPGRAATKYFTYLSGVLVTEKGVRLAMPRYTCDPKDFNRGAGRPGKRATQLDLAVCMLERLLTMLPPNVRLVVLADSYFESKKLFNFAKTKNIVFISPSDSNRCFGTSDSKHSSTGERLRDRKSCLRSSQYSRFDLRRGSEGTASYRRYSARKARPKDRRTYRVHHERRTVAGLGPVGITYSWKTPVYEPQANFRKKSFKILLSSDLSLSGQEVVEFYEMRYGAIEHTIREWKGDLGFENNLSQSLESMERFLDVVLLTFLMLELYRVELLESPGTDDELRERARHARTQGMQALLWREVNLEFLATIERSFTSKRIARLLKRHLSRPLSRGVLAACGART